MILQSLLSGVFLSGKHPEQDMALKAGDTIVVPWGDG